MAMYGTDDKTSCGQKVSFNLQPRWYRQYSRPGIFTNEIFWRWAGRPPGYRTGQKEKQTPPTSLRKGGPPCRRGWGGHLAGGDTPEMRRLTLRNGLYAMGYLASR